MPILATLAFVVSVGANQPVSANELARGAKLLLVPLDSRPASGQFAQMIGKIADLDVRMPPYESLGRFTVPGDPDRVLSWLEKQPLQECAAVVASADMIAYGGLIESRVNSVNSDLAISRLNRLVRLKDKNPDLKLYIFSATMRLAPTATREAAPWRMNLARFVELEDKAQRTGLLTARKEANRLRGLIPAGVIGRYYATRRRNTAVQRSLVSMAGRGQIDYLVVGQDDARQYGPHVAETRQLQLNTAREAAQDRTYFCEGIDQLSNVLLSRSLLVQNRWTPKVRVVWSDPDRAKQFAPFESKPIEDSLRDQLLAAGAVPGTDEDFDYSLYVNVPRPDKDKFAQFGEALGAELDNGLPVAVADINLANDGTSDPRIFSLLTENDRANHLLSFAGWNTAGNTMGTAIPASNLYLLARKINADGVRRELAQREFLLHRFVDDYAFHKFVRPAAYQLIKTLPGASKEETTGESFSALNEFVRDDLAKYTDQYFQDFFKSKTFFVLGKEYAIRELDDVKVWLPWPRAYEVRIEFRMESGMVSDARERTTSR